jgi:uncharacterized protein YyaL (SSP411 family)
MEPTNQLQFEKSPYLLQHKDNPVHWQPWGPAAFAKAQAENKPIFLSIGYSTCHWCHVMAHESFEDIEVAEVLNRGFINIKVDREELPDVDGVYMSAVQALTGGGGWPMSLWLTAEGKPFFAGTYFPKYRLMQLLRRIQEIWHSDNDKLIADSERLTAAVRQLAQLEPSSGDDADYEEFLHTYINHFQLHYDEAHGGFGGAPKFPQTMNLMVMMRQDREFGQAEAMVNGTLTHMVRGGVYDQLMGGFHRYSVDEKWLVPHFEKMLYDQALLSVTMVEAFQRYGEPLLQRACRETLDYVLREMTHKEGGFFSAQDADSLDPQGHMEEGYFCTYAYSELQSALTAEELEAIKTIYGVTPAGNFEGRNILYLRADVESDPELESARHKLRELRAAHPQPHLDDKVISAWNGWMVWALAKAGIAWSEPRYIRAAQKAMHFIKQNLWHEKQLQRYWRDGEAKGRGTAEDYASLIHACIELYQADFDSTWAQWALELQTLLDEHFWDGEEGNYFANDGQDDLLPIRPRDDYDGVTPCSNSMAAYNLERLYLLTGEPLFKQKAQRIISGLFGKLKQHPSGLPFLALAVDLQMADEAQVAVVSGKGWVNDYLDRERRKFQPHRLWAMADTHWPVTQGKGGSEPTLYICEDGQCRSPITTENFIRQ